MRHSYSKYDIRELQERILLLVATLQKNCKYRMVGVHPKVCTFFDDGPRYREECAMRACPVLEKEKE